MYQLIIATMKQYQECLCKWDIMLTMICIVLCDMTHFTLHIYKHFINRIQVK